MKASVWFHAQGARMAGQGRPLSDSPLWPHRNQMPTYAWMAFTRGFDQNSHSVKPASKAKTRRITVANRHCSTCPVYSECRYPYKPTDCYDYRKFTREGQQPPTPAVSSAAPAHPGANVSAEFLLDELEKLLRDMPEEPFAKFMREKGCPPPEWVLVLPSKMLIGRTSPLPRYVHASEAVDTPVAFRWFDYLWDLWGNN